MKSDRDILATFVGYSWTSKDTFYKWSELELTFLSKTRIDMMIEVELGARKPLIEHNLLPEQIEKQIMCEKINMGLMEVPF